MKKITNLSNGSVKLDTTNLERIQKELKKKFYVKVGVIGGKSPMLRPSRSAGETAKAYRKRIKKMTAQERKKASAQPISNSEIGMIHEFGSESRSIPARSWLRMPLILQMPKVFKSVGQKLLDSITSENIVTVYKSLGARAEAVIQKAFATRGFGNWAPNTPATIKRKKSDAPLIDTAEFRKSVTSEVVSKK